MALRAAGRKNIRLLAAAGVLAGAATAVALASFAGVAFASPSIGLSPSGPYTGGQSITVTGSGFTGSEAPGPTGLAIIECADPGGSAGNLPTDSGSQCDASTVTGSQINVSGANGSFSAPYTIFQLTEATGSTINCDATDFCVLWVGVDYNNEFLSGPHVFSAPFEVNQSSPTAQTITFSSSAPTSATVGGPTYTAAASATSGLPVTLTIDSSSSSVCSISGSVVSFLASGVCRIDANQAGNGTYAAAPQMQQSFMVNPAVQSNGFITSTASPSTIVLGPTSNVSDGVTLQGNATNGSPLGTLNFYVCRTGTSQTLTTGPCAVSSGSHLSITHPVAGANDSSSATSGMFTPTAAGTWCFSATYTSTNGYSSAADNTLTTNFDPNECVLVATAASGATSFISAAQVTLGPTGTVTDDVTVSGTFIGGSPTGTVTFYACRTASTTTFTSGPCSATGTPADPGDALVAGAGATSSATSISFTPTAVGTWCFSVVYGGDANYMGSTDNTSATNVDPDECVLVSAASSTTATTVRPTTVNLGSSGTITDSVIVTGNAAGGAPTGSVDFYLCGPTATDSLCTSTTTPAGVPTLVANGADTSTAASTVFTPTAAGIYCFAAVYVPDVAANYIGSSDNNTGSVDANECATVSIQPFSFFSNDHATAVAGSTFSFTVKTNGSPAASVKKKGALPKALHFVDNHDGTATILGIPSTKKTGVYYLTFTATFGKGKTKHVATQAFTLTVT